MQTNFIKQTFVESKDTISVLFKLIIPVLIIIKILEELGILALLNNVLNPLMSLVGLPEAMGAIWLAAIFSNLYAAMILFFELSLQQDISIAQSTILCSMMLVAHGLLLEGSVARKTGMRFSTNVIFRFVFAYLLGLILNLVYATYHLYDQPIKLVWRPSINSDTLNSWILGQFYNLIAIAIIIFLVILIMNLLKKSGIETWLLKPVTSVLRALGIDKKTASFTFVGMILGILYGAGLLIKEVEQEHIDKKDVASSMLLLGLCHAIIEDTLLMLSLGASLSGIFFARIFFTLLVIFWLNKIVQSDQPWINKILYVKNTSIK